MVFATLLMREFGLSELAIDNIAYLIGFASVIYFPPTARKKNPPPPAGIRPPPAPARVSIPRAAKVG